MPFEIPQNLHPNVAPFAWLLGTWEGGGDGAYPTIEPFQFRQQVIFQQDGRPFMHYMATAWLVDENGDKIRDAAQETGFLRCLEGGSVEWLLTHNTGFLELWHGKVDGAKLEVTTDAVLRTETAKEVTGGHRLYGLVEGDLWFAYDMAAAGQALQPHLWGKLVRT